MQGNGQTGHAKKNALISVHNEVSLDCDVTTCRLDNGEAMSTKGCEAGKESRDHKKLLTHTPLITR